MNKRWKTWAPFQSKKVREICAHLTDEEFDTLVQESMNFVTVVGKWFVVPISITGAVAYVIIANYGGSIAFALVPCALIFVSLALVPRLQKIQKELLCSTAWAKEQGIEPDSLKLFSFQAGGE